jgi:O-antigen/teichoic acid export membrane protein
VSSVEAVPAGAPPQKQAPQGPIRTGLKNISWIWTGLAIKIVVSFFMAPFVVASLGNVYYGIWTLLDQFTSYLWLFDFGVRDSIIKYVAQYYASDQRKELTSVVDTAVALYSAISAAVMLAIVVMAIALPYVFNIPAESVWTARITLIITGAGIAQAFVFNVYAGALMGVQKFYLVDRLGILFTIPRTILMVVMLKAGYGIIALALISFTVTTIANLLIYHYCRLELPYLGFRLHWPAREELGRIVTYGKYVLVNNIGEKLIYASDGVIIGMFLPIASLTYFAVAGTLLGFLKAFVVAMATVLNPMSSALDSQKDERRLRLLFLTSAKAAMLCGLPLCIGFIVLGERFISIWMGQAFGPISGPLLAILAVAHLIGLPSYAITQILYGLAKPRIPAIMRICEAVANIVLSVILVRKFGLIGSALGTMIPNIIITAIVLPTAVPKLMPVALKDYYVSTYLRPLLASIPFWVVCYAIDRVVAPTTLVTFLGSVGAGLIAYLVPCWFGALSGDERQMIASRVGKRRSRPDPASANAI